MTDKKQPEALRLAALIEKTRVRGSLRDQAAVERDQAAVELRRQHAELETLRTGYAAARMEIESLRAAQPAPQPGAAYAALPEYGINTASHAHFRVLGFTADQMRAFADATCALRASHVQAPAPAAQGDELDVVLDAFEHKMRGIPQAHIAAALVAELRAAIDAARAAQEGKSHDNT